MNHLDDLVTGALADECSYDSARLPTIDQVHARADSHRSRLGRRRGLLGTTAAACIALAGTFVIASIRGDAPHILQNASPVTSDPAQLADHSTTPFSGPKADGPERFQRVTTSGLSVTLLAEPSTALTQRVTARLEQATKDAEAAGRQGVPKRCFPDRGFTLDITLDGKAQLDAVDRDGFALPLSGAVLRVAEANGRRTPDGRLLNLVVVRSDPNADVRVSLVVDDRTVDTVSPLAGWAVLVSVTDDLSFLSDVGIRGAVVVTNASGTELGRLDVPANETPGEYCPK